MASQVWGRDDGSGGLIFKQEDVDRVVQAADHRGPAAKAYPLKQDHGESILSLCVSDQNKGLLLNSEGFIPLLVDSLLLDPEHPRRDEDTLIGAGDFEVTKGPVQRVSTVCLVVSSVVTLA